jgi:hypothetical protein
MSGQCATAEKLAAQLRTAAQIALSVAASTTPFRLTS